MRNLDTRLLRLEADSALPVTAEAFFAELMTWKVPNWGRFDELSRRMPEEELELAIADLDRLLDQVEGEQVNALESTD